MRTLARLMLRSTGRRSDLALKRLPDILDRMQPVIQVQPGTMITPNVRLVRPLGAGGMGAVWVADHLSLKTEVVVKFMSPELALNVDAVARFKREAEAAARVKSPHVVQVFDFGV